MFRLVARVGIFFGGVLLVISGILLVARRDDPSAEWVVFSVKQKYLNAYDIYAVLSDGTHTRLIATSSNQFVSVWRTLKNPGWLVMQDSAGGENRVQYIHLSRHTELVVSSSTIWPSLLYYDRHRHTAYVTIPDNWTDLRQIWLVDTATGQRTPFELSLNLYNLRAELDNGEGYIVWSDHASAGDLYSVRFADPPITTRLTTHGKVLQEVASIGSTGWLYYLVDDADPDAYTHLYRIRTNGTHEELVAEQVLNPPNAIQFWEGDGETIYYWGGDTGDPRLFAARPNRSQATELPIPLIFGGVRSWSPDHEWMYYTESSSPYTALPTSGGNLRRVNLLTGENQVVWEPTNMRQMIWSTDQQWIILLTLGQMGYSNLYKMRPDGSEVVLLTDDLHNDNYLHQLDTVPAFAYSTWGVVGEELHLMDLRTLEIRRIHDDAPGGIRNLWTTLPMPNFDWQAGWLIGIGIAAVGVGVMAQRRG